MGEISEMKLKGTEKCMNIIDNTLRKLKIEKRKLPKKAIKKDKNGQEKVTDIEGRQTG